MAAVFFEDLSVFADAGGAVVVEVFAEELEDAWLADGLVVEDAGDFALDVFAGFEVPLGEGGAEVIVLGADVGKGGVDGEGEFVALQHHATMRVGLTVFTKLGAEERIAVEKDGDETEEDTLFFAECGDGFVRDSQVEGGLVFTRRAQGEGFKEEADDYAQTLVADAGGGHQLIHRRQRAEDSLFVKDDIEASVLAGDFFDLIGELIRLGCGTVGHESQNLFRDAGKLERLGAVDGVKEGVIAQAVVPDHGQARLKTADAKIVGITETPQIAIQTEIDLGFPFQV